MAVNKDSTELFRLLLGKAEAISKPQPIVFMGETCTVLSVLHETEPYSIVISPDGGGGWTH